MSKLRKMKRSNAEYGRLNRKRKRAVDPFPVDLDSVADNAVYKHSVMHKKSARLFGGGAGNARKRGKRDARNLCDDIRAMSPDEANDLLKAGIRKGWVRDKFVDGFPKQVWSIVDGKHPVEAQLGNAAKGEYHGYPLDSDRDEMYHEILDWHRSELP